MIRYGEEIDPAEYPEWGPEKKALWAIRRAILDYQPRAYDGKITYIQASDTKFLDVYRRWEQLATDMEWIMIEGGHEDIAKGAQAATLARIIANITRADLPLTGLAL